MEVGDQVDNRFSAPVVLGHNKLVLETRNRKIPALKSKFVGTNEGGQVE